MRRELILLYVSLLLLASGGIIRADVGESGEGPLAPDNCTEYDVRLAESNNGYMGMVEACYTPPGANSSLWGPICFTSSNDWTVGHAKTICTQLGFPSKDAVAVSYENVTGPYSYGSVWCSSLNPPSSLRGCNAEETAPSCNRVRAGGVICHVPEDDRCETGAVRQVNGTKLAGRVEVCFNGLWGTVCRFERWSSLEASVVCRQLGLGNDSAIPIGVTTDAMFGAGQSTQPILVKNVVCSGNESNITECSHSDVNHVELCYHTDDAGVICQAPPGSCRDGDIRVQGGTVGTVDSVSGNIEVCYTGLWGTVCAATADWTDENALVACRQLGYAEVETTEVRPLLGDFHLQSLLSGVNCSGSEKRLADCHHNGVDLVDTTGCARAFVRCLKQIPTPGNSSSTEVTAVIIGGSVGATVLLLLLVIVVVTATRIVLKEQAVRKKMSYNLENARQSPSVPAYIDMRPRLASNYLEPVSSRNQVDMYSEWREVLKSILLTEDQLTLTESLGEGAFGRVYKGSMKCSDDAPIEVAVKTLKDISQPENTDNFVKESILMLGFDHPNVLKLLGVCFDTSGHLPLIVLPFMANGDLRSYLMSKRDPSVSTRITHFPEGLDEQRALGMCLDVARGMEYLSNSSFIHRDLAARNCMVSGELTVHIADFGLSRDVYSKDYYRMGTKTMLPVKWMAPESLADNTFTVKSDVWSFGVVCWEVFSLGSTPYPGVGNHEVSDYIGGGHRLKIPKLCPPEIYHIMEQCWSEDSNRRPDFSHLVLQLEKVSAGRNKNQDPHYINMNNGTTSQNGHAVQPQ